MRELNTYRLDGNSAFIGIGRGFEVAVDIADLILMRKYTWRLLSCPSGHAYAVRHESGNAILMHRELLNASRGVHVDHKDGDGLNNRRENIRLCSPALNMANKIVERRNKLGIKGVTRHKSGSFRATIKPAGKTIHLGYYRSADEAAAAYKGAARVLWGDFAHEK